MSNGRRGRADKKRSPPPSSSLSFTYSPILPILSFAAFAQTYTSGIVGNLEWNSEEKAVDGRDVRKSMGFACNPFKTRSFESSVRAIRLFTISNLPKNCRPFIGAKSEASHPRRLATASFFGRRDVTSESGGTIRPSACPSTRLNLFRQRSVSDLIEWTA